MRWNSKDHNEWTAALIMVPVVLVLFALIRVISPGWSAPAAALVAAAVGVAIVRLAFVWHRRRVQTPGG